MKEDYVALVSYAVQSKGPVPSGLMLEGGAHLAGSLLKAGYSPTVYDFNNINSIRKINSNGKPTFIEEVVKHLDQEVKAKDIKMIGFTLYTNGFQDNIQIAKRLKERNPNLLIAAGGPLVGWFEDEVLNYTDAFDVLVRGEGDQAIGRLADLVYREGSINDVPGAIYRNGSEIRRNPRVQADIFNLPFPVYDPEVYPSLDDKIKVSTLRTTVGCRWGRCSFCVQPKIDGKYRERNIDDVLGEIEFLREKYGITNFRLSDPNPSPEHLKQLFDQLPDDVKISCFAYSDQDYDFSNTRNNLIGLFIGVESMDPSSLSSMRKTADPETYVRECEEMLREAKKNGVATVYANLVPLPNDSTQRIEEDLQRVLTLQPDFVTALPLGPLPGTPIHREIIKKGDVTGVRLDPEFKRKLMLYELDLLQPPSSWQLPPWQLRVDGEFNDNPFKYTGTFVNELAQDGIGIASDEIVLMAHLYHKGLDEDQKKRREQVLQFQDIVRKNIATGQGLEDVLRRINDELQR